MALELADVLSDLQSLKYDLEMLDSDQKRKEEHEDVLEARCEALAEAVGSLVSAAGVTPPSTGYNSDSGVAYLAMDVDKALRNGGSQ